MNQRQMFALGFFVVLLILLYQIAIIFRPFLLPVLWAVILAHMTFPLHRRLTALLGQRKGLSAAILTVAVIGLVVVPLVIFIVQLIEEAGSAYVLAKTWIDGGGLKTAPGQLSQLPIIGGYVQPILGRLVVSQGDLETSLLHNIQALSGFFVEQLTGLATNLFLLIMNFLVMLFTLFFFFKDGDRLYRNLYEVVPLDARDNSQKGARGAEGQSVWHFLSF